MKTTLPMTSWSTRLLVLLLLFSAQSFSLAHEINHVSDNDAGLMCEVCLAGQSLDSAVLTTFEPPVGQAELRFHVRKPVTTHIKAEAAAYTARAPPLNNGS